MSEIDEIQQDLDDQNNKDFIDAISSAWNNNKKLIWVLLLAGIGYVYTTTSAQIPAEVYVLGPYFAIAGAIAYGLRKDFLGWISIPDKKIVLKLHINHEVDAPTLDVGLYRIGAEAWNQYEFVEGNPFVHKHLVICEDIDIDDRKVYGSHLEEMSSYKLIAYKKQLEMVRNELMDRYTDAEADNVNQDVDQLISIFTAMSFIIDAILEQTQIDEEDINDIVSDSGLEEEVEKATGEDIQMDDVLETGTDEEEQS